MIFCSIFFFGFSQTENRLQHDSVYKNRKVKRIYIYQNSPKDLSEIIDFDQSGKMSTSTKFSASSDRKSRKRKKVDVVSSYTYNDYGQLSKISDTLKHDSSKSTINFSVLQYNNQGKLTVKRDYKNGFESPYYITYYTYNPYKTQTVQDIDSIIVYNKTKEYERDFYVKRFHGYSYEPKLKQITQNGNTTQYSNRNDLVRYDDDMNIKNMFDMNGRLITSNIKSIFMNDRTISYNLKYSYFKNGLLKSIRGYVPEYFKYEFY